MIMLSNFLKIDIFVARNLSKMPKFMNALRPKNILNYVRILRLTFVFYWNKSNIFFMLKAKKVVSFQKRFLNLVRCVLNSFKIEL